MTLHDPDPALARAVFDVAAARLAGPPAELGATPAPEEIAAAAGAAITPEGLGAERALALLRDVVLPATIAIDHPRYLAFIPSAPTPAAALADLVASAFSIYGGSWLEGAGPVHAENEALRWLADLAGFPEGAGGCFVQGGTNGNLSALHAARERVRHGGAGATRVAVSAEVHSSVRSMLRVMDAGTLEVPVDGGRLTGEALGAALDADGGAGVFAVVATAGTTNLGQIDDLTGVAAVCRERGLWLHVDGAYGLGALCAPSARHRFAGIEHADSFIVDPHKWLYAPFDSCALVYREPAYARAAHRQHASYLDALYDADADAWNPSDYGVHLTRRARGLPFWFSLAVHGTDAYAAAVEHALAVTRAGAEEIRARPQLELLAEPELTVLVFRRRGWAAADYTRWSEGLRHAGTAFVLSTTVAGGGGAPPPPGDPRGQSPRVVAYARCMRRIVAATVLAIAVLLGFSSCAQTDLSTSDIYKVGCPAVDAAAGGSSAVSKVTVAGLKKLSESGKLDPEPQRWVDAVITLFDSEDPRNAPDEVQKLVIEGCAKNGYPLQNLHVG
jgi:L-2,4-diaminobutyrate decarboxylase